MRRIAVVARLRSPQLPEALERLFGVARGHLVFSEELRPFLPPDARVLLPEELAGEAEVFLSLGGDGTLLRAAYWARGKPVAGVNLGYLGFLAFYSLEELERLVDALLRGEYREEERLTLDLLCGGRPTDRALNDVVVMTASPRMMEIEVWAGGEPVTRYRGDGLIISTPTGSTAYNLAAGGPIVHPGAEAVVLTPICAHKLTLRPIVLSADEEIEVTVRARKGKILVSADGRDSHCTQDEVRLSVRRSATPVKFAMTPWAPKFFEVLKRKLNWG